TPQDSGVGRNYGSPEIISTPPARLMAPPAETRARTPCCIVWVTSLPLLNPETEMRYSPYARLSAGLLAVGGLLCGVGGAAAQEKQHHHPSHIHHALHELKEARRDLSQAKHDFGGHRAAALQAVDFAIQQLELV